MFSNKYAVALVLGREQLSKTTGKTKKRPPNARLPNMMVVGSIENNVNAKCILVKKVLAQKTIPH